MNLRSILLVLALGAFATSALATTYVIKFGGTLGKVYEPKVLMGIAIGDTIQWEGYFQFHPLLATQLPATAPEFYYDDIDTIFIYVPMVDGEYKYICTAHPGMEGSFIVGDAGVDHAETFELNAFPNPVSKNLNITFSLVEAANTNIDIFDIHGKQVASTNGAWSSGMNSTHVNVATLPAGIYYYRLETPEGTAMRTFTVSR